MSERLAHEERLRKQAESLAQTTAELKVANEELSQRQEDSERSGKKSGYAKVLQSLP